MTATKILLVAGMANLVIGGLSGIPMGLARMNGADAAPKYLTMVHLGALGQGPILLGVAFALTISTLSPWIDTFGAIVLSVASALLLLKDTINWRQGVADEFAEGSLGLAIGNVFGPCFLGGIGVATAGVISGL